MLASHIMHMNCFSLFFLQKLWRHLVCAALISAITFGASAQVTVSIKAPAYACAGQDSVEAIAITAGGGPYSYHWSNGETTDTAFNLQAGQISVTVTANNSQTASASASIGLDLFDFALTELQPGCNNLYATVTAAITEGSGIFYYHWSNGDSGVTANNLTAGNYSITVSDTNLCSVSLAFHVNQDTALDVSLSTTGSTGSNGTAIAVITQGVPPYHYNWSNGGVTDTITSLAPGNYTVTVIDGMGCSDTLSGIVQNLTGITGPVDPSLSINIYPNPSNGPFTVVLTGTGYHSIKLLNELGQPVYTGALNAGQQEQKLQLDVSGFDNGIYLVQIIKQSGSISKRVVLQK
jgi:Secretion system C-terminal sorting domain